MRAGHIPITANWSLPTLSAIDPLSHIARTGDVAAEWEAAFATPVVTPLESIVKRVSSNGRKVASQAKNVGSIPITRSSYAGVNEQRETQGFPP